MVAQVQLMRVLVLVLVLVLALVLVQAPVPGPVAVQVAARLAVTVPVQVTVQVQQHYQQQRQLRCCRYRFHHWRHQHPWRCPCFPWCVTAVCWWVCTRMKRLIQSWTRRSTTRGTSR